MPDAAQTTPLPERPSLILLVIGISTFLGAMSFSLVAVALPEMGRVLGVSLEASSWVMLSFLLAATITMLPAGQAGDSYGLKRIYIGGFWVVGAATLVCGLADSFLTVAIFRAFHGLGGAFVMAAGPALLTTSFPSHQRGTVLGIIATSTYAGLTFGPALGSVIVSTLGWRWVFLYNVPMAALVIFLGGRYIPLGRRLGHPLDWRGISMLTIGVPLTLLPLATVARAGYQHWMPISFTLGLVVLALFVYQQAHSERPLLDLKLLRKPVFAGAVASAVANYVALFTVLLLVPFYLEEGMGYPASRTGFFLSAQPIAMTLVSTPSGRLSDRYGPRWLSIIGMAVLAAGLGLMGLLGQSMGTGMLVVSLLVVGLGTGIFISPNSSALMGAAPRSQQGQAAAVLALARNFGMLIGTALAAGVFFAAGGRTGARWGDTDYRAFSIALFCGAAAALVGAVLTGLRNRS